MKYEILYIAIFALLACALVFAAYKTHQAKVNSSETEMVFHLDKVKEYRKFERPEEDPLEYSHGKFKDATFYYQAKLNYDVDYENKTRFYTWTSNKLEWFRRIDGVVVRVEINDYDKADQIEQMIEDIIALAEKHLDDGFTRIRIDVLDGNKDIGIGQLIKTYTYNRPNG